MSISQSTRTFIIEEHRAEMSRTAEGVVRINAQDDDNLAAALGWAHAEDRLVQMVMTRLVGQGRLSECLKADETTLGIDIFMRTLGIANDPSADLEMLDPATRTLTEAYCAGVNSWLEHNRRPVELLLVGYQPEPWSPPDCLALVKLMSYVGLAQSQQDMEKLIIQALHGGVEPSVLCRLFGPHLDGLENKTVELIKQLQYIEPLVPPDIRLSPMIPKLMASNNWAVAPTRTASGAALQCNDPHLECNRLPAVWYEAIMHTANDYRVGITMPGLPGLIMGRTSQISYGFTYGFMDLIDYFVEDINDGSARREEGSCPLKTRRETILRKGKPEVEISIHSSDRGVIESDPASPDLSDGLYLARAWSADQHGAAASLNALRAILNVETAPEAQEIAREVSISCNWVLADRRGDIAFQQSGQLPIRAHSGLYPVPAWQESLAWKGLVPPETLHAYRNPDCGFIVTANDDINPPDGPLTVNLPMGPYRRDRIADLLGRKSGLTVADMQEIQTDLYSTQAEMFMPLIRPHIPDTSAGRILASWDLRYDVESRGATLFEDFYHRLLEAVFSAGVFGVEAWKHIISQTSVAADYYWFFDRALLSDETNWYGDDGRDKVLAGIVSATFEGVEAHGIPPWGDVQQITMTNIFFDGLLPGWLGFDHGPVAIPGNRATIVQAGVFTSHDRQTSFCPSYRYVTDLGRDEIHTVIPGGPSGRRSSKFYTSEIAAWLNGRYKVLRPDTPGRHENE